MDCIEYVNCVVRLAHEARKKGDRDRWNQRVVFGVAEHSLDPANANHVPAHRPGTSKNACRIAKQTWCKRLTVSEIERARAGAPGVDAWSYPVAIR